MQENDSPMENQDDDFTNTSSSDNEYSKCLQTRIIINIWIDCH